MIAYILTILVGLLCIVLAVPIRRGNLKSLHSYHIKRIKDEDRLPFGRLIGMGMIILGLAIMVFGGLSIVSLLKNNEIFSTIGYGIMTAGIVTGLGICFYALFKYNKGIF